MAQSCCGGCRRARCFSGGGALPPCAPRRLMPVPRPASLPLQAFLALWGSRTAYAGKPGAVATEASLAGRELGLAALVQARNNARAAVLGSLDMLSDAFFGAAAKDREGNRRAALAPHGVV